MSATVNIFWMRRDLRLHDNQGLYRALKADLPVVLVFVFDSNILSELPPHDKRVRYLHHRLQQLNHQLKPHQTTIQVYYGTPQQAFEQICSQFDVKNVYANRDYEPYATTRDAQMGAWLNERGVSLRMYKDAVVFEPNAIKNQQGEPYKVFTPYSKIWLKQLTQNPVVHYPSENHLSQAMQGLPMRLPTLSAMGFTEGPHDFPPSNTQNNLLQHYADTRNYPAQAGTSRVGPYLRFGTISVRQLVQQAQQLNAQTYLNELIWREFYQAILFHYPQVVTQAFKPAYDKIPWRDAPDELEKWKQGQTGYPLVDAGMRQLTATGYMHNRVRMVTASFLVKHLLIDWREGEAWFAQHLLDYELASNNGGWQWAAGCGTDAAPYFRIFNPESQLKKFDPKGQYVKKYVPEWGTANYPKPMVEHSFARQRALSTFKDALG